MNNIIIFIGKQIAVLKLLNSAHKYNNNIMLLSENKKEKFIFLFLQCIIFDYFLLLQNVFS